MRSGGDDVATAIPEEPLSSLRQRFGAGPPRITMVDSEAVQTLTPLRYYLITQATDECALLLWHCGLRHMSGATWEPAIEAGLPLDVIESLVLCASGTPVAEAYADSSTSIDKQGAADKAIIEHFYSLLRAAFGLGAGEAFEDGMETGFSEELVECVEAGRSSAVHALRRLLDEGYAGQEVGGEALRWLGCANQPDTRDVRRLTLEHYLQSDSAYLRDGAAIGLSEMDDPAALPAIKAAASKGTSPLMLKRLQQLQEQLEDTRSCPTSSG